MKFRKKPVVVEAIKWDAVRIADVSEFLNAQMVRIVDGKILIETLEGTMHADIGDWIIKEVKGEFYPCKPDIFKATYEPVEDS